MENTKFSFEYLSLQHVPALCGLYKIIFNKTVSESFFINKYNLSDSQQQYSTIARNRGKIIGMFGAMPQKFSNKKGEKLRIISACDFFLLKKYRKTGIFNQLYQQTLYKAEKNNFDYIFAIQSRQTYKVCKKWNWLDQFHFNRYHFPVYPFSTARILDQIGLNNWRAKKLEKLLGPYHSDFDINRFKPQQKLMNDYNQIFWKSKIHASHFFIELNGCSLILKYDYLLTIGFLCVKKENDLSKTITELKSICRKCLIHEIVFQLQSNSIEAQKLTELSQAKNSFPVSYLPLKDTTVPFEQVKINFIDMDVF